MTENKEDLKNTLIEVTTVLALLVHREKGSIKISRKEFENLPKAEFSMRVLEDEVEVLLDYGTTN